MHSPTSPVFPFLRTYVTTQFCKSIGCISETDRGRDFCANCAQQSLVAAAPDSELDTRTMAEKYPKYYKDVSDLSEIDVYAVHQRFNVIDPTGAIHHASKKLLLSGSRTGGKSQYKDIREARDTLTRWLQLNPEQ